MARYTFPFAVYPATGYSNRPRAGFLDGHDAHAYARWLSATFPSTSFEVVADDGIVGQYIGGSPTPEFIGRGDEHYPAGPR